MSIPSAISVKKLFSQTVIRVPTTLPAAFRTGNTAIVILGLASGHEARPRAPLRRCYEGSRRAGRRC